MEMNPAIRYAIIENDVASLLQEWIYRPCTLELWVHLWTQSRYNGLRRLIGSGLIMHDTMTSIRSIKCMATQ